MTIATIMRGKGDEVVTVEAHAKVREAVALLAGRRIGAMPVMEGGAVVGVISERDIVYGLADGGESLLDRAVRDVMSSPAITVTRDVTVLAALSQMTRRRIRHLPVVENESLAGIVSIGDLVKHRIDRIEQEADALRTYIQGA